MYMKNDIGNFESCNILSINKYYIRHLLDLIDYFFFIFYTRSMNYFLTMFFFRTNMRISEENTYTYFVSIYILYIIKFVYDISLSSNFPENGLY